MATNAFLQHDDILSSSANIVTMNTFWSMLYRYLNTLVYNEKFSDTLCIDTMPDAKGTQNNLKYMDKIQEAKNFNTNTLKVLIPIASVTLIKDSVTEPTPEQSLAAAFATAAAHIKIIAIPLRGRERFSKLETGEWAIVDMPKEQEYIDRNIITLPSFQSNNDSAPEAG